MKQKNDIAKAIVRLALFLGVASIAVTMTISRMSRPLAHTAGPRAAGMSGTDLGRLHELFREGVGSEVYLASDADGPGQVRASVDSVRGFILERSGFALDPDIAAKLTAMEQRTLSGAAKRISCNDLSDLVLATVADRFRHSSDADIERAADELSNVKASGSPGSGPPSNDPRAASAAGSATGAGITASGLSAVAAGDSIMLRTDGRGIMSRREFVTAARQFRNQVSVPTQMLALAGLVRPLARQEFQRRLTMLGDVLPEQWGDSARRGLTPVQAFLLTYSVVADDSLGRSREGLQTQMKWAQTVGQRTSPDYPSSDGRVAYGPNGYLFSSPVDLILDKETSNRLLDKLGERTSK